MPEFTDGSFDIAFSNSVIEHLFTLEQQKAMAREIAPGCLRPIGCKRQTSGFPWNRTSTYSGWQWLPVSIRVAIIRASIVRLERPYT